jgi:hypothetical protein
MHTAPWLAAQVGGHERVRCQGTDAEVGIVCAVECGIFLQTLRNTIALASSYTCAARFLVDAFEQIGTVDGKVQLMTTAQAKVLMVFANSLFAGRGETDTEKRVLSDVVVRLCYAPWLLSTSDGVFISDSICYLGNGAQPPQDAAVLARLMTQFKNLRKDSLNQSTWYPR